MVTLHGTTNAAHYTTTTMQKMLCRWKHLAHIHTVESLGQKLEMEEK